MLSHRRQLILQAVIEEYVANALPVASKALVKNYGLGVSSATIRNELSALEGEGYIAQPHTSAGRIPTDFGYRTFVDDLLAQEHLQGDSKYTSQVKDLCEGARELDELMERTSQVLTKMTDCLSVVLPPSTLSLHLKQISLVYMAPGKLLMVVVTESSRVLNRSVAVPEDLTPEEARSMEAFLNQVFAGKNFAEMRAELEGARNTILHDATMQNIVSELFACLKDGEGSHACKLGFSSLMAQPEFTQSQRLVPILEAVEDGSLVVSALRSMRERDMVVSIGHENDHESLSDVSVVAARYGSGDSAGVIAVIGPTRMRYGKIISAIRSVQHELNDL